MVDDPVPVLSHGIFSVATAGDWPRDLLDPRLERGV